MHYLEHLCKDQQLKKIINNNLLPPLPARKNSCIRLVASIISQQLSTKVAATIYKRFLALYDGKEPSPEQLLSTPAETLRALGLSMAKVSYVQNVARFALSQGMDIHKLKSMSNDEIIAYLTQIKGVGKWTVEMLLIFGLGREDVFAADDLGIQQSMIKLYKLNPQDKKIFRRELLRISHKWAPYRSYGCRYLWAWKDDKENGR